MCKNLALKPQKHQRKPEKESEIISLYYFLWLIIKYLTIKYAELTMAIFKEKMDCGVAQKKPIFSDGLFCIISFLRLLADSYFFSQNCFQSIWPYRYQSNGYMQFGFQISNVFF